MAEKQGDRPKKEKKFDPDERFRYIGFEIETGKLGDHFKSEAEKESWVKRILEKRKKGFRLRDETSFDKPRVAGLEKIVLTVTSLVLIATLFLPWFSGYKEYEVVAEVAATPTHEAVADSLGMGANTDSTMMAVSDSVTAVMGTENTDMAAAADEAMTPAGEQGTAASTEGGFDEQQKDERGFASITSAVKRKEYRKEHFSSSAIGSLGMLGMVFASGFVLKLTGLLFLIYMLMCIGMAGITLYTLYGIKGDDDARALKLKKMLSYGWLALVIWFTCFVLSFFGASYSFDTTDAIKQLGTEYGVGTYLSVMAYGFYLSLACFILGAAKAAEI